MSQQTMRKAARLAASDTHPSRTQRSQLGVVSRSDRGPRSSCCRGVEPRGYWSLSACPQVPAAIAKFHTFRTIQMYGRPTRGRVRCSELWQASTGRVADLETR
jgi:hypothetical protein